MSHKLIQSTRYSGELSEILAPPAHPAPEVVAFIKRKDGKRWRLYWEDEFLPGDEIEPLMTVAQHERIVAALTRPAQAEQQLVADLYEIGGKLLEIAHTKTKAVSTTLMAPHRDYTLKDARATALVMGERLVGMADRLGRAAPIVQEVNKI